MEKINAQNVMLVNKKQKALCEKNVGTVGMQLLSSTLQFDKPIYCTALYYQNLQCFRKSFVKIQLYNLPIQLCIIYLNQIMVCKFTFATMQVHLQGSDPAVGLQNKIGTQKSAPIVAD